MSLVIVGSLAFDTIETPWERREKIVGGSGTYCSLAASFFTRPKVVGVVGTDFPPETMALFKRRGIDTRGIVVRRGKTFHWEGKYGRDPNQRTTIRTELNVFRSFKPHLPPAYRKGDIVFLANIDPDTHDHILGQVAEPKLIAMDTIRLWIETKREAIFRQLKHMDIFFANDEEIKLLSGESNLIKGGRKLLELGPSTIVMKKGSTERSSSAGILYSESWLIRARTLSTRPARGTALPAGSWATWTK